jgi:hypothetical protein
MKSSSLLSWGKFDRRLEKLHINELNNLHYSTYIIRMVKLRRIGWAGYATNGGNEKYFQNFCRKKLKVKDNL